jgi:ribosomal protein S18 acetylase RimI-like enzyme
MTTVDQIDTRLAQPSDFAAALDVWRRANEARDKAPDPQRIARVRAKLTDPAALLVVAVEVDAVVGMALSEPGRDADGAGPPLPELCHISMVFVHPDHWGRRIGQDLLAVIAEHSVHRGHTSLQLWTGQRNHRAQRLYERAGFRPSGRTHRLGGELILHLARDLPPADTRSSTLD